MGGENVFFVRPRMCLVSNVISWTPTYSALGRVCADYFNAAGGQTDVSHHFHSIAHSDISWQYLGDVLGIYWSNFGDILPISRLFELLIFCFQQDVHHHFDSFTYSEISWEYCRDTKNISSTYQEDILGI